VGLFDGLRKLLGGERSAGKQEGDVHALDRTDDPRGGVQSPEYRHAGPTDVVEDAGVAMSGPAGAPSDESPLEERRRESDERREAGDDLERRVD
jgi:hypothetical protein